MTRPRAVFSILLCDNLPALPREDVTKDLDAALGTALGLARASQAGTTHVWKPRRRGLYRGVSDFDIRRNAENTLFILVTDVDPGIAPAARLAGFPLQKHAAQRTRRAEAAREFFIDMAARPREAGKAARACAAVRCRAPSHRTRLASDLLR